MIEETSEHKIISRKEAIAAGLTHYFTGTPCKRGHILPRLIYSQGCKVCSYEHCKARRAIKRNEIRRKQRENYRANKERHSAYKKEWRLKKLREDPDYEKRQSLRSIESRRLASRKSASKRRSTIEGCLNNRIACKLNRYLSGTARSSSWNQVLSYTLDELKSHIERQFAKGMGWHNREEWHIDHIVPLSSFNFKSPSDPEFQAAWALTNLRPLWKRQNQQKTNKIQFLL